MPFMIWNDRLVVGIEAVDKEHRKLVEILNTLYDGAQCGIGRDLLSSLFDELLNYTEYHFAREEKLFVSCNYPAALDHAFEHAKMVDWLTQARAEFLRGTLPGPSLQVMNFLKDWLFDHILESDKRFGEYFAAQEKC
ncbi:MAG: bacteriohemerythrin [Terracidiphilus sp.]